MILNPSSDPVWVRCSQDGTGPSDNDEDDHNVQSRCGTWWQVHQSSGHRERKQRWLWLKPPLITDLAVIILVAVHNISYHPCNHRYTGDPKWPIWDKKTKMAGLLMSRCGPKRPQTINIDFFTFLDQFRQSLRFCSKALWLKKHKEIIFVRKGPKGCKWAQIGQKHAILIM